MRISGGKARGVSLRISRSAVHRPAMDKLRQSIFSSLGNRVEGASVCDLFAGTGSYGLEALSRGARNCIFVEKNNQACRMIEENCRIVAKSMAQPDLDTRIIATDATKLSIQDKADIVFVDPPYDIIEKVASRLFAVFSEILANEGAVAFEMPGNIDLPLPPEWQFVKRFGKGRHQPTICLFERSDKNALSEQPQ